VVAIPEVGKILRIGSKPLPNKRLMRYTTRFSSLQALDKRPCIRFAAMPRRLLTGIASKQAGDASA